MDFYNTSRGVELVRQSLTFYLVSKDARLFAATVVLLWCGVRDSRFASSRASYHVFV